MSGLAAIGVRPDHDLHVLIERGEKLHQAFDGEPCKLVVTPKYMNCIVKTTNIKRQILEIRLILFTPPEASD